MENQSVKTALISAITAIATALITAGVTIFTQSNSAKESAQAASNQAQLAQASAEQAKASALVPSGAVVAMQGECPTGWLPFEAASGRFIIGADGTFAKGSNGGRRDMLFENIGEGRYGISGTLSYRPSLNQSGVTSGDKVLNVPIIPPYIALKMCVKK